MQVAPDVVIGLSLGGAFGLGVLGLALILRLYVRSFLRKHPRSSPAPCCSTDSTEP